MRAALHTVAKAAVGLGLVLGAASAAAAGPTFIVNSTADAIASAPLDSGPCETAPGNGVCTLRAAIMKANRFPGGGATIRFGIPGPATYQLTIPTSGNVQDDDRGDLYVTSAIAIIGNGVDNTIIDGNGAVIHDRIFRFDAPGALLSMSHLTLMNGRADGVGGAIMNSNGSLTLDHCVLTGNMASAMGGGIFNDSAAQLAIVDSSIAGNHAAQLGGGIYNSGALRILRSSISSNSTQPSTPGWGGGIHIASTLAIAISESTIDGNTAESGGGIYVDYGLPVIINTTISGNSSTGNGGGIYLSTGFSGLYNATVTNNTTNDDGVGIGQGGGVFTTANATLNFVDTIIADNNKVVPQGAFQLLIADDCSGNLQSNGYNLMSSINSSYCAIGGSATVTVAEPGLGPLQNNGGPTSTHALLAGSPAIAAGNVSGCVDDMGAALTHDQRGAPRPYPAGGRCDIGAFEAGLPWGTLDVDASVTQTRYDALTDGLLVLRGLFGLTGAVLTSNALGPTAQRTDAGAIQAYLTANAAALDIDGNGQPDALTDGLLILRYLFGIRGAALVQNAIGSGATRHTAAQVESYIASLVP